MGRDLVRVLVTVMMSKCGTSVDTSSQSSRLAAGDCRVNGEVISIWKADKAICGGGMEDVNHVFPSIKRRTISNFYKPSLAHIQWHPHHLASASPLSSWTVSSKGCGWCGESEWRWSQRVAGHANQASLKGCWRRMIHFRLSKGSQKGQIEDSTLWIAAPWSHRTHRMMLIFHTHKLVLTSAACLASSGPKQKSGW